MGRRIKSFSIAIAAILLIVFIPLACDNNLLANLIVDVERATNNILIINTDGNGTTVPSGEVIVKSGEVVSISATPNTGYVFLSWTGTGITFGNRYSADTTVSLAGKTATITANFADALDVKDLTINSGGNGVTDPFGTIFALPGNPVSISATPNYSYEFVDWEIIGGSPPPSFGDPNSANTTVTVTANSIIQANFSLLQYWLTVTNDGNGTTTPATPQYVTHGVATLITATVADPMKYVFKNWTVPIGTADIGNSGSTSTNATLTSGDAAVKANFNKYGVYWTTYTGPFTVNRAFSDFSYMEQIIGASYSHTGIDLDIANKNLYFAEFSGKIWKCKLDGSGLTQIYLGSQIHAISLDLVNTPNKLYFASGSTQDIGRINLDGTGFQMVATAGVFAARGIAVDGAGGYVYWTDISNGTISRADITGFLPAPPQAITGGLNYPYEIDLDLTPGSEKMYWVEAASKRCNRANLDGTGRETWNIGGAYPTGISLDVNNSLMYIVDQNANLISIYFFDGSLISQFSFPGGPRNIAVDTD